jgi:hypothetical protein
MPNQQTHGDQMDELLSFDDSFGGFTTHFLSASTCAVPQSLSGWLSEASFSVTFRVLCGFLVFGDLAIGQNPGT